MPQVSGVKGLGDKVTTMTPEQKARELIAASFIRLAGRCKTPAKWTSRPPWASPSKSSRWKRASLDIRAFALFLVVALTGVCLGAERKPASTPQGKEPTYEGRTLSQWITLAKDKDPMVRVDAVLGLGKVGPGAGPVLMELLKDKDVVVRMFARSALWQMGPGAKTTVPALTKLLQDKEAEATE